MQAYVMDSYSQHTASAMAAVLLLRSITGFAFPTFAPVLFDKLGYGLGKQYIGFAFMPSTCLRLCSSGNLEHESGPKANRSCDAWRV